MKMNRAVWIVALLIWLANIQPGWSFYNPSVGKWLSRDPVGEVGGINLYLFADNHPTMVFDLDGRMTLREFPTVLPQPPTTGDYAGYNGLTWFEKFEPKAKVYKSIVSPCCWKVFLPGQADLYYWWVNNAPSIDPGTTAMQHEMQHVAVHRDTYYGFNAFASSYVGPCFSKTKAACWKNLINGPLKAAWLAHNHTANLQVDQSYRWREILPAVAAETAAWIELAKEVVRCEITE